MKHLVALCVLLGSLEDRMGEYWSMQKRVFLFIDLKKMNNYENAMFRSSEEVLHVLGSILGCLQRGRSSLIVPRKRTIDDLMKSRNMVCLLL